MWTAWSRLRLKERGRCQGKQRIRKQATDTQTDYSAYKECTNNYKPTVAFPLITWSGMPLHVHKTGGTWETDIYKFRSSKRNFFFFFFSPRRLWPWTSTRSLFLGHLFISTANARVMRRQQQTETEGNNQRGRDNLSENLHMSGNNTREFLKWMWALRRDGTWRFSSLALFPSCPLTLLLSIFSTLRDLLLLLLLFFLSPNRLPNDKTVDRTWHRSQETLKWSGTKSCKLIQMYLCSAAPHITSAGTRGLGSASCWVFILPFMRWYETECLLFTP